MMDSIDSERFEALAREPGVTIFQFTASWCGPCKALKPMLEAVAEEKQVRVAAIDIDAEQELAVRFAVRAVPTVVVCQSGQEIERFVGLQPRAAVEAMVTRACSARAPS
jgi:thioredoxin 1